MPKQLSEMTLTAADFRLEYALREAAVPGGWPNGKSRLRGKPVFHKGSLMASSLRSYLREMLPELADVAESLWKRAKGLHDRQTAKGSYTENGERHVLAVERNIWALLTSETRYKGAHVLDNPFEVFVLTCAACTHDFDKAFHPDHPPFAIAELIPKEGYRHGQGSAIYLEGPIGSSGLQSGKCKRRQLSFGFTTKSVRGTTGISLAGFHSKTWAMARRLGPSSWQPL